MEFGDPAIGRSAVLSKSTEADVLGPDRALSVPMALDFLRDAAAAVCSENGVVCGFIPPRGLPVSLREVAVRVRLLDGQLGERVSP